MHFILRRFVLLLVIGSFISVTNLVHAQEGVQIEVDSDTLFLCLGDSITLTATGADTYMWTPSEVFDNADSSVVTILPTESVMVFVEGMTDDTTTIDSIFISVADVSISLEWSADGEEPFCQGDSINIIATTSPDDLDVVWIIEGLMDVEGKDITIGAPAGGSIIAQTTLDGCTVSDTIMIDVSDFAVPNLVTEDTLVCQGQVFSLTDFAGMTGTLYEWVPGDFLDDPTSPNPTFTATESVEYVFYVTSPDSLCRDSFEINIEVTPIELTLNVPDTSFICLGDTLDVRAQVNGDPSGFSWFPDDGVISSTTDLEVQIYPDFSNIYIATYELDGCTLIDTIFISVDSIPLGTEITSVPFEEDYCPGEEISLFSTMYDGLSFPDITFDWEPKDGSVQSPTDAYNLFITTTVTNTYIRTITNGGCEQIDSIEIIVKEPEIELNLTDTIVCPGEPVQIRILNDVTDIMWSPAQGLSCTDCPDPVATVNQTTTYTVQGENQDCPVSASVTIQVYNIPILNLEVEPQPEDLYRGDSVFVTVASFNPMLPEETEFFWVYNGSNAGTSEELVTFADNDVNTVSATYVTDDGCEVTVTRDIIAQEPEYDIPSAFTPDNDMINDVFRVVVKGNIEVKEIRIYSRWGQQVFSGNNNDGWDGMFRGREAPPEVYAYVVIIELPSGRTIRERGDVTLLR